MKCQGTGCSADSDALKLSKGIRFIVFCCSNDSDGTCW